jgi:hypothetical protein
MSPQGESKKGERYQSLYFLKTTPRRGGVERNRAEPYFFEDDPSKRGS